MGYYTSYGYKGYIGDGKWMLFVSEEDYLEFLNND